MIVTPRHPSIRNRRRTASLAVVAALAIVLTGCTTSVADTATTTIVVYNAQHEQTTAALVTAFEKQTGINVRIDNGGEDVLTAKIEQEGSRSPADVIYTENTNWLQQLADKGLLARVRPSTLRAIPALDNAADGEWVGISARVSGVVYNTQKLKASEIPTSVLDLADPKWKGKIELAPSETDFWPIVSSVEHTYGHARALAWLRGLKANAGANIVPDNETLVSDVNHGVAEIGIINHYYYARLKAETTAGSLHAGLAYFAPKDAGYIKTISGAAVLESSHFPSAAQKLVAFLTSRAGQSTIARGESFEYPLASGVVPNPAIAPLGALSPSGFAAATFGNGQAAKKLLQEAELL